MNITVCGGGSLGLVCSAVLSAAPDTRVSLLTNRPDQWQHLIGCTDPEGKCYQGRLHAISNQPADVLQDADWVLLCLPGFLIEETLRRLRPHLGHAAVGSIVSSTGFFFFAHDMLPPETPLFGFRRTPFIARIAEYGSKGLLLGYKPEIQVAVEHMADGEAFRQLAERLFRTPTVLLDNFYEASLTNSNPILHTGRLYTLWHDYRGEALQRPILFYRDWTDEASDLLIRMDAEFMELLDRLPQGSHPIPPLLTYYESHDAVSLTAKIRSITAFQSIVAPMKQSPAGWVPDFGSRYFTEDFPFGLRFIRDLAHTHRVSTPTIDRVYEWGLSVAQTR